MTKRPPNIAARLRSEPPSRRAAHLNLGLVLLESDPNAAAESFRRAAALRGSRSGDAHVILPARRSSAAASSPTPLRNTTAGLTLLLPAINRYRSLRWLRPCLSAGRAAEAEAQFRDAIALDQRGTRWRGKRRGRRYGDTGNCWFPQKAVSAPKASDAKLHDSRKIRTSRNLAA